MEQHPNDIAAFPCALPQDYVDFQHGLSLRDYFAATAVQGLCNHGELYDRGTLGIANIAYEIADAMLLARAAQSPKEKQDAHIAEFGK